MLLIFSATSALTNFTVEARSHLMSTLILNVNPMPFSNLLQSSKVPLSVEEMPTQLHSSIRTTLEYILKEDRLYLTCMLFQAMHQCTERPHI